MRLTLRTLLAYLDDILSPEDREDLQQQIDASDFAADLVYRTRDATRHIRLGAVEPLGNGPLDDPNTMAEYLDNALPEESLAEFERSCLESDAMLAEAAACHHVLAMVLEQPVQIDPDTRQRMHDLADMLDELQQVRDMEAKLVAGDQQAEQAQPALPQARPVAVPVDEDSIADGGSTSLVTWSMVVLAVVLLGLAYAFTQDGAQPQVALQDEAQEPESPAGAEADVEAGDQQTEADPVETDAVDPTAQNVDDAANETQPVGAPGEGTAESTPIEEQAPEPELEGQPLEEGIATADPEPGAETGVIPATEPTEPPMAEGATDPSAMVPPAEESVEPEPTAEPDASEQEPIDLATILKADDALLMLEQDAETWGRASTGDVADTGSRLLSLPTYRSVIRLRNDIQVELVGLAMVQLSYSSTDADTPKLELRHGRVVIQNVAEESTGEVELVVGGAVGRVTIESGAFLAVSAMRVFTPGVDLINRSPAMQTIAYTPMGGVVWAAGGDNYGFGGSKKWRLSEQGELIEVTAYQGDSGWIEGLRLSAWDDQASPLLVRGIMPGQEAWPQLMEIIDRDPLKEVRALATRCSAAVGHPDPLVASLDDETQQPIWRANIQELRDLASRGTIEASRVRQAMIEMNGERNGEDLFRMLRGFDRDQVGQTESELQAGALPQLIEWLESESLPIRVMATVNLEQITGRTEIFEPTETPRGRQRIVRRLQRQLRENELTPAGA